MSRPQLYSRLPDEAQHLSPVSRDLDNIAVELTSMAADMPLEQWARVRLVVMQLRGISDQVEHLVVPFDGPTIMEA